MKTIPQFIWCMFFACITLVFVSCSNYGEPVSMNYPVNGSYTKLSVSHAFDVTVSDDIASAVVTVPERLHDKVKVAVLNGTLYIGYKNSLSFTGSDVQASVVLPRNAQLSDLDLSGASSFCGDLKGSDVEIDLSGASEFQGNVMADEMEIDLSGASKASLSGSCAGMIDIEVSGASYLNAASVDAQSVQGDLSGASSADVTICNNVKVNLSGASHLTYGLLSSDCQPVVKCESSGSSTVEQR